MSECPTLADLLMFSPSYLGSEWESPPHYSTLEEAWREVAWSGSRDLFLRSAVIYAVAREGDLDNARRLLSRARVEVGEEMNRLTRLKGTQYLDALEAQIDRFPSLDSTPRDPHREWVCRQVEDALEAVESEWNLNRPPSIDSLARAVETLGSFTSIPQVDLQAAWIVLALAMEGNVEWSEVFFNVIHNMRPSSPKGWFARRYLVQVCTLEYAHAVSRLGFRPSRPHYFDAEEFEKWSRLEPESSGAESSGAGDEAEVETAPAPVP